MVYITMNYIRFSFICQPMECNVPSMSFIAFHCTAMTKTNKFNDGEFQQMCGNVITSASCLAQARINHENIHFRFRTNNADVLLDSGLKLSDIIVK